MVCVSILILGLAVDLNATPKTFTGSSGNLAAEVIFDNSGTYLIVTLTNTSPADVMVPANVLTGVFFSGASGLTPISAVLPTGSTVLFGSANGGNMGGEWAYASGLSGAPGGAVQGISSSGLGLFGGANFGGPNLQGPPNGAVDGLQYGITSAGDVLSTGNNAVTGRENNPSALIKNSVVFTLSGLPTGFDPSTGISNVSFQYGTHLEEPNFPSRPPETPEPATLLLLGSGLAGLGLWGRKRKQKERN